MTKTKTSTNDCGEHNRIDDHEGELDIVFAHLSTD